MICKNCNSLIDGNTNFCSNCGAPIEQEQPQNLSKPTEIPENLKPLSPWAYFGLQILFSIPIVGFIFLIIFSCKKSNINRRNFARSYWCSLIIVAVILIIAIILGVLGALNREIIMY